MASVAEIKKKLKEKGITNSSKDKEEDGGYKGSSKYEEIKKKVKSQGLSFDDMGIDQSYINTFIDDTNKFFNTAQNDSKVLGWSTASPTYEATHESYSDLYQRASNIRTWMNSNKGKMDSKTYESLSSALNQFQRQGSSVVNSFKDAHNYYSKFDTEEDLNNYQIGWLRDDAETNSETAAKRQEKFQSNKDRIAEIEKELSSQGFFEILFADYDKQMARDALIKEKESLEAENNKYERGQYQTDKYYTPVTEEFTQNGAYRDYTNASMEELRKHDAQYSTIIANSYGYDFDGNIVDAGGRVVYDADDPMVTAMRNNDTDSFWDTVVQDKLGMFLSASQEDLDEAYNRISAHNGNVYDHWAIMLTEGDTNGWKQLSDYEINLYYHLYKTQGQEAAYQYLEDMTVELTRRATEERAKNISEAKLLEQIMNNVASVPMNVFGGGVAILSDIGNAIEGKEYNPYSAGHAWLNDASAIRQDTANDINTATGNASLPWVGTTFGDVYQALMSSADSAVGAAMGGTAYGALMGMSSATSEMKDLYERGASTEQMVAGGILAGAAEMVFEKYSIDSLVKMGDAKTIGTVILNALKQGGIEASEEALTEIANTLSDAIVMGSQTDWVDTETFIKNVVNAGIGGFISGGTMGGVMSAINYGVYNQEATKHGQDILDTSGQQGIDALKQLALDMYSDKGGIEALRGNRLVGKVANKASAKNVGKLSDLMNDTISAQNRSDIQSALEKKGLSKKDAKRIAEYLSSTEALTAEQQAEIKENKDIEAVVTELLENPRSSISERSRSLLYARLGFSTKKSNVASAVKKSGDLSVNNDVDVSKKISDSGKTTDASTGKTVTINKENAIAKTKIVDGKRIVYYNTDQGVVESSNVRYASKEEGLLYESFVDMNPAFANAVIKNYDGTVPIQTYIKGMREGIIVYGMNNFQAVGKDISTASFLAELSVADQDFALKLGRAYVASNAKKAEKDFVKAVKTVAEQAKASEAKSTTEGTEKKAKKGTVRLEEGVEIKGSKAEIRSKKKAVSLAKHLASAIGIDIVFYDSTQRERGSLGSAENGYYDEDTDTIYLDIQNGRDDTQTIAFTLSHELVHFIKKNSPTKFDTFAKFLMEQYAAHGVDTSKLLAKKMEDLGTDDYNLAYEEMICDACETMLLDSNAMVKLMELRKEDLDLFETIKLHIYKLLNNLREEYRKFGHEYTTDEAKALLEMTDVIDQIYAKFEDAAVGATKNYQADQMLNNEAVSVSKNGTIKMQMKQYEQTGRSTLLKYLRSQYGNDNATDLIATIDNIYNTLAEIKKDTALSVFGKWQDTEVELDENGHPIFTTSINNGDYELNQDFSRVCKKRRQLNFVLNMLAEDPAFEASNLTKEDFVKINNAIKDHGFEIACALCFVDSKRFRQTEWADSFANTWNDIISSMKADDAHLSRFNFATKSINMADEGIKIDTSKPITFRKWSDGKVSETRTYKNLDDLLKREGNANIKRIATLIRDNPELRHEFRGADIIASDGFDSIQRHAPDIRGILDGWGGTSVPKPSSNDAIYDNSILNISGYNEKKAFAVGGVRMNSFSDFMAHMFFDYAQAFADLSAKGLLMHSYTKELDFARLFGLTGGKINMSAIAAIRSNATDIDKIKKKADKEKATEFEKSIAGLDISRLADKLGKAESEITYDDVIKNLDDVDYVWADESIDVRSATLLQSGILYDNLTEGQAAYCYELIREGKFEEAFKIAGEANVNKGYAKHLGIITVGVSRAHILKLLRDPTIRMVIPYHKSGLNAIIAKALKIAFYDDFTDVQNTMVQKDGKQVGITKDGAKVEYTDTDGEIQNKNLKDFSFYDYFGKTIDGVFYDGKATAAKYLEWCEKGVYDESVGDYVYYLKNGKDYVLASDLHAQGIEIIPKFSEFAAEENYYKLVEDFDCYDTITGEHSSQEAVDLFHDGLPSDYKDVLVKALKAEQKVSDDFRDHLDNKGLRDEIMEIVKPHGYTPSDMSETLDNIVEDIGVENIAEVTEQFTDVENTTRIKKQKKKSLDNTYENIGKELMYYEEGNLAPDLTLVETINDRTGNKEVTIKHHGQKPKDYIPKKIAYCYKLFEQHPDGTLHALFAGAKNAVPMGEWRYAQGFPRTDDGVQGMNLRERYGWHLSAGLPSAPHLMSSKYFERGYPSKGQYGHPKKSKRVWVRMAYDASTDFNSIADSTGSQNDIYGLIPFGGYYAFKENNQSEWVISSAVKIDKILTEDERQQILREAGYDEYEAWRLRYQPTPEERAARELANKERAKAKARAKKLGIDSELSASTKAMRESIKSRIIDNPELKGIKKQAKKNRDNFVEDKYFRTQMQKWDNLPRGKYVKVGEIKEDHPLVKVGMPHGDIKYDVDKLNKNMAKHQYLNTDLLQSIPDILANPIAISEYMQEANTVSVFGDVFVGSSPMMVGVTIAKDRSGATISKVRTYNARRDIGTLITDDSVLYLNEDKKRTRNWFQVCGIQVPLGETKFGFIRSISQNISSVKRQMKKTSDTDYLDAVNRGDMETAQKMVDEVAWREGYRTHSMKDSVPSKVFHGTNAKFTVFSHDAKTVHGKYFGKGFYFTDSESAAEFFAGKGTYYYNPKTGEFDLEKERYVKGVYLDMGRSMSVNAQHFKSMSELQRVIYDAFAKNPDYDGLVVYNIKDGTDDLSTVYVVKNANQIKSADPVTYDDNGNVIPLSERFDSSTKDIRYQKKKVSNRSLLANALESVAQNDIEKNKLKQYKEKIALIDSEQAKLSDLRAKIKELSFATGVRDTKAIKSLQFEANQVASRINTYDKQLLNLEATSALKNVLEREKELVRKRTEEKGREALKAAQEKATKVQKEQIELFRETKKKAVNRVRETREKQEATKKLQKLVLDTARWISYPSKTEVKCPDILKEPYAGFLNSIDLSSKRSLKGGEPTKNDLKIASTMDSLATAIEQVKNAQDPGTNTMTILDSGYLDLPHDFVEQLRTIAENIKKMMVSGDPVVNQMTSTEIKQLSKLIRTLNHAIKEMSTLYANARFSNVEELGYKSIQFLLNMGEAKNSNGLTDFTVWDNALPYYAYKRFGEGGESIRDELMDAQDKLAFLASEIFAFKEKTWTDKEAKAWGEDTHTINLPSGGSLTLTTADAMGIYCLSRREQGRQHLLGGGTRVIGMKKGMKKANDSRSTLTEADILAIVNSLSDRQIEVANAIQEFMSTVCSEWGNEISMKRFLTKEFTEKFYYPIESNDENLDTKDPKAQQSDLFRLLNISATKPLTPGANNEVIIRNIFEVFTEHASDMARLNAFGLALLDQMKWLNYREKTVADDGRITVSGVRKSMEIAYGSKAKSYVINLIKDINGRHNDNSDNSFLMNMIRTQKTASVGNNLRVAFLQFTSYPRAAMVLSTGSLAKGLTGITRISKSINNAKKYCGIALWKSYGFYDTNIARSIEDQIKGATNIRQKIIELSMKGPEWADTITWGVLWKACEYEVAKTTKNKVGSEAFYQEVGLKLREVVYATQVVDSVLTRSQIMRSKSGLTQTTTAYMSEPTLTHNILMDAGFQFQKEKRISGDAKIAWKKTGKIVCGAIGNYCIIQLLTSIAESLADAWRDDDDEEFYEKFLEAFGGNLITNIIPFNKIPIISDIADLILSFFGIGFVSSDNLATAWITQAADAVKVWVEVLGEKFGGDETSKTVYNAIYKTAKVISSITGVSISGAMREVVAVWNNTAGEYDSTLKIRMYELSSEELGNELYEAMIEGDSRQEESLRGQFDDEASIKRAIRKALRDNDPRIKEAAQAWIDDVSEYDRLIEEIVDEGNFDIADIKAAIKAEYNDLKPDEPTTPSDKLVSMYDVEHYYMAVMDGDVALADKIKEDIILTDVSNGEDREDAEKSFNSSLRTQIRNEFAEGTLTRNDAMSMLVQYGDLDSDEAYWKMKEFDYYVENGTTEGYSKYNSFYEAVKTGKNLKSVISEYTSHGVKKSTLASQITSYYKPLYIQMSKSERASIRGYLLNAYALLGYDRDEKARDINKWLEN